MKDSIDLFDCLTKEEKEQCRISGIIAAAIENERYKLGITLRELADKAGIPHKTLQNLERGARNISPELLAELRDKLNIDPYAIQNKEI